MLPANEMLPISAESTIADETSVSSRPAAGACTWNSASAMSAAAPPPTPLKSATICGIAVMLTCARRDGADDGADRHRDHDLRVVLDLVLGERDDDRERHPGRADPVPEARALGRGEEPEREDEEYDRHQIEEVGQVLYSSAVCGPSLEHLEHPVGDDEAADDVRRRERDGDEADDPREPSASGAPGDDDRAHDDDSVDRVRARHQRRVQHRRHLRDHLEAEEDREHEDRQLDQERAVDSRRHLASGHARAGGDLVVPVERELALGSEVRAERGDVARVELARVRRHRARQVRAARRS